MKGEIMKKDPPTHPKTSRPPILIAIAAAQAEANHTDRPYYVVRDPYTKRYDPIPADNYRAKATRRHIIEFVAFPEHNGE
jgi:hypothetical protein